MKNIAVVNATGLTPYAIRPLRDGKSAFEMSLQAARSLPGAAGVVVLARDEAMVDAACRAAGVEVRLRKSWDVAGLIHQIASEAESFDHVLYLFGDCPLYDTALAERMFESHTRYYADYTFADGYPVGLSVEIMKRALLAPLEKLAELAAGPPARDTIFSLVQRDINSFDLETELSPVDLRSLRLVLAADTKRNFHLLERLMERGAASSQDVARIVTESPEILRTLPAYVNVQIVEGCPQLCSYCPYPPTRLRAAGVSAPGKVGEMPPERFAALLDSVERSLGDAVVSVSLWGEPSLHSAIAPLVLDAVAREGITVHIETSGVGWTRESLERIRSGSARAPVWIVSLDAWSAETYARLRGAGFAEALATAEQLRGLFPDSTYLQAVRMRENEEDTEAFFRGWKERKAATIIQKYDSFAGLLPDRKVTDLSPLKRLPCWHLKRDLVVLLDGSVPMCRELLQPAEPLGNVFRDGIDSVWARGQEVYLRHVREDYPDPCRNCDEYYTFNA